MIAPCLLDTDTLSEVLKSRNAAVTANVAAYLQAHSGFAISAITWYEIVRFLRWKNAHAQLAHFELMGDRLTIHPVTADILNRSADLWAIAATQGRPKADADLIIAATAIHHGLELVTGNTAHFNWIPMLTIRDWRI